MNLGTCCTGEKERRAGTLGNVLYMKDGQRALAKGSQK
jgi:hypothetical protein